MAPNLTKPKVLADGLTKSGKKATAFLLSILKSCGMSTMSRSARPSSRFSTSRFQSMQLWGVGGGSQGGLAGMVGGGPQGHVWLRMDKMPSAHRSALHTKLLLVSLHQNMPARSPRHSLTPWQGA